MSFGLGQTFVSRRFAAGRGHYAQIMFFFGSLVFGCCCEMVTSSPEESQFSTEIENTDIKWRQRKGLQNPALSLVVLKKMERVLCFLGRS